jgi:carbon storage regulator
VLVVTRKLNEALVIDDKIRVHVIEITAGRVRIGIEAPRWMEVLRGEFLETIGRAPDQLDEPADDDDNVVK